MKHSALVSALLMMDMRKTYASVYVCAHNDGKRIMIIDKR